MTSSVSILIPKLDPIEDSMISSSSEFSSIKLVSFKIDISISTSPVKFPISKSGLRCNL